MSPVTLIGTPSGRSVSDRRIEQGASGALFCGQKYSWVCLSRTAITSLDRSLRVVYLRTLAWMWHKDDSRDRRTVRPLPSYRHSSRTITESASSVINCAAILWARDLRASKALPFRFDAISLAHSLASKAAACRHARSRMQIDIGSIGLWCSDLAGAIADTKGETLRGGSVRHRHMEWPLRAIIRPMGRHLQGPGMIWSLAAKNRLSRPLMLANGEPPRGATVEPRCPAR